MDLFLGAGWESILTILEERHGEKMPEDIVERFVKLADERMGHGLKAVQDADKALSNLRRSFLTCVASNGERANVFKGLGITGLLPHFHAAQIFTKNQVERPKPAPDLFLFACEKMQVEPANALVIEDSVAGVAAARAAGIHVLGFTGTAHDKENHAEMLKNAGADAIIDTLIHIEAHLKT
ncbi:MAG: HAD-IA family hydrolase [Alphaproteobacteria bacterium]